MGAKTFRLDDKLVSAREHETVLEAAAEAGTSIPTLCDLSGLSAVGACRLCVVEVDGFSRPQPACLTRVQEGMVVRSSSPRLLEYRKMLLELLLAERNHVCSVCVANGDCQLQDLCAELGVDHVRFDYLHPEHRVDLSHPLFGLDPNRCVLCTRCVRVCNEVEGAETWGVAGRGLGTRVITDLAQPWGEAQSCTSCGKCVAACPTGALFRLGAGVGESTKERARLLRLLVHRREKS